MDDIYTEADRKYDERVIALRKRFMTKRLGDFTGAEFDAYLKLLGYRSVLGPTRFHFAEEELKLLEEALDLKG